jgi:hypothetical protein
MLPNVKEKLTWAIRYSNESIIYLLAARSNFDIFVGRRRRHVQGRTSCTGTRHNKIQAALTSEPTCCGTSRQEFQKAQTAIDRIHTESLSCWFTHVECCTTRVRMGQVWRRLQNHEREDRTLSTWLERLWKHFDIFLATTVKHVLSHLAMCCWRQLLFCS